MKYIFVDLGAYTGDTIQEYLKLPVFNNPKHTEVYGFEPNPDVWDTLCKSCEDLKCSYSLSKQAAWIEDGEIEFAVDKTKTPMGSTVMSGKAAIWDYYPHIKVPAFDFSKWLQRFKYDYVIVKMDIEGAEFPILEKMLKDGTDRIMKKLYIETHQNKVSGYSAEDADRILKSLHCEHEGIA